MNGAMGAARESIVVGLMSGTSLDGISAAVVQFSEAGEIEREDSLTATLLSFVQCAYDREQRHRIEQAMQSGTAREYCRLHVDMGDWLADAALLAMARANVSRDHVTCIASHGQTLWHEAGHSTWQIGDPSLIAERTGCDVLADFRARDVAAGGQGAPLVPIADAMLFAHDTEWRALQNIGGIANVTVVPPRNAPQRLDLVRAFDTGPGVVLIDTVTRLLRPELPYDVDGLLARSGRVIDAIVDAALDAPYFNEAPPKSTGRELFTRAYAQQFIADCQRHGGSHEDTVASAVSLTARSITDQYRRFINEPVRECLISGGGARNPALVSALRNAFASVPGTQNAPISVRSFDECYFDGEAKEAVAFALLGYLSYQGKSGNVPTATGARGPRRLGVMVRA